LTPLTGASVAADRGLGLPERLDDVQAAARAISSAASSAVILSVFTTRS
jgi:hypothetical protein